MDAAVAMDAKTASTATWKTAQNAVSHSAHPHYSLHALHTKNLTLPSVFIRGGMIRVIRVHPWLVLLRVHPWNNSRLSVFMSNDPWTLARFIEAQLQPFRHN